VADRFVSTVAIESRGGHDRVRVFVRHQLVGELVCAVGDGERLRAILLEEESERPTAPPPEPEAPPVAAPSLLDMVLKKKQKLFIEDVPWFVKDFSVLYTSAKNVVEACEGRGIYEGRPYPALANLKAQLQRLEHAAAHCEQVRHAAVQRGAR
jgi:hypothetical protein